MAQSDSGIGNVTPNADLVQMAMSYSCSYMLCAAARLGVAGHGDAVRSVDHLATRSELFAPTVRPARQFTKTLASSWH